ncbi:hypothetical protein [Streptomyces sp. NPDC057199]|uniref:hypothetical protein n=1 Tax=Streptomyces sp. NPDC057199 TaxID=3346047 RepID=UPI00363678B8
MQPNAEWLYQLCKGQFVYNTIAEKNTTLGIEGDTAWLVARRRHLGDASHHSHKSVSDVRAALDAVRENQIRIDRRMLLTLRAPAAWRYRRRRKPSPRSRSPIRS